MGKKTLVVLLLAVIIGSAFAQELPRLINYQGKLTDPAGVAVDAPVDITFRIYDVETGGTALWTEAHTGASRITVTNGLFDVQLGGITDLDLPFDDEYWIELQVGAEVLTPREKLATVPYAFRAIYADTAFIIGSGAVQTDGTIDGDGTDADPLGVVWGSVTQHTDVTNAGSGAIITTAERALLHASGSDNQDLFNRVSDGTNTYTVASETDILTFAAGAGAGVAVNPTTGVVTIDASSAGDEWGSQVVESDATLTGEGVTGNLLGIAADGVNTTHIDWGLGANEVGAGDVPYDNTTSGLTASDVQAALDEITGGGSAINHSLQDAYDDGAAITVATGTPVSITSTGATHALTAVSGSGRAVNASNNSGTNAAVYATNAGTGPAIYSSGHLRMSGASGVKIYSTADLNIQLDEGGSGATTNTFHIRDDAFASVFTVDENGDVVANGNITATNNLLGADLNLGGTLLSSTAAASGAGLVGYNNTASGLTATDVQDAIDELDAAIAASGDGWGSDVVNSDATLTGNGTLGSPLGVVWGSVTQHSDVTNAGSGAIITAAERALLHAEGSDLQDLGFVNGGSTYSYFEHTVTITDGTNATIRDYYDPNTDEQDLSLDGTNLNISGGSGVSLAGFMDNTDEQDLSYTAATRALDITDGSGVTLPLFSTSTATAGFVPGSSGATGSFLRGDGTWATPSTGDNNYVNGISFDTGTGVLTLTRAGLGNLTQNLDGRYLTGNQTITLTGDVTGSGETSITTTIANLAWSKLANGTANRILMTNGSGGITVAPAPTTDYYLKWNGTAYVWAAASTDLENLTAGNGLSGTDYNGSTARTFAVNAGNGIEIVSDAVTVDAADGTIDVSADGIKVGLGAAQSTSTSYQLYRNY